MGGHTEGCVIGVKLPDNEVLFFLPQTGYAEIIDAKGCRVTQPGGKGELVVTGFNNQIFPFIRYRTMDIMTLGNKQCPFIHIGHVEGRRQDYAINKLGELIAVAPVIFNYNIDWTGVQNFQIIQDLPGILLIKVSVVSNTQDLSSLANRLQRQIRLGFSNMFKIELEFTTEIHTIGRGKSRYFVQNIVKGINV